MSPPGRRSSAVRALATTAAALACAAWLLLPAGTARATTWPDVEARVERDLASPDVLARRSAAHDLERLRGAAAAALVKTALDDADPEVKLAGAEMAARTTVPGASARVIPWLGDRDARVRLAACEVLRANPDAAAVGPLGRALGDGDALVRAGAAEALGAASGAEAVPALLGHLDDSTPLVRLAVIHALARLRDPRSVTPLIGKIQDAAPEVRQAVARAIGESAEPRTVPALVLLLRDASPEVRAEALRALARVRATSSIEAIAALLADRSPWVRQEAATALGRIASTEAVRRLVLALATEEHDLSAVPSSTPIRLALVRAGVAADLALALALDHSSSQAMSAGAAWVLGERHQHARAAQIVAAFRRGSLPAADALHALAGAGGPAELPVVLESLADPSSLVRAEALTAAAQLLDPAHPDGRAVEPLAAVLTSTRLSAAEHARVTALLGRTGAARVIPLLAPLTRSADDASRIAALDALGELGFVADRSAEVDRALLPALTDADPRTRLHAAAAVARAGGDIARARLVASLSGGDEIDRAALTTALTGLLARRPDEAAARALLAAFDLSGGADRDALLPVLGEAARASVAVRDRLQRLAREGSDEDRRTLATAIPLLDIQQKDQGQGEATAPPPFAVSLATDLLADVDPRVRAQAAWALGELADPGSEGALVARLADSDGAVVANSVIALARVDRVNQRTVGGSPARARTSAAICALLGADSSPVRANALTALREIGLRCGAGDAERALLVDTSEDVREAAARLLFGAPGARDLRALDTCAGSDPSPRVAELCDGAAPATVTARESVTSPLTVFVVPATRDTPQPLAPYVAALPDGELRVGTTDRRGAFFEAHPSAGEISLRAVTADPSAARPSHPPAVAANSGALSSPGTAPSRSP